MKKEEYKKNIHEITDWDKDVYELLVTTELTKEQETQIVTPPMILPYQKEVIGVHWHPEIIPFPLIEQRVANMFPNKQKELLIPTQHNELLDYKGYSGVEIDCFSKEFNRKVQLLVHFKKERVKDAGVFRSMLDHTFKYRASQFFELIDAIIEPKQEKILQEAIKKSATDKEVVEFTKNYTKKLKMMIDNNFNNTSTVSLKNKLLPNYIIMLKDFFDEKLIERSLLFIKSIKKIVKREFKLDFFYDTNEFIEEIKSLGGGIIIPHPEQFWPILLADYDVDGIEVWNPQSREFTKFLVDVVIKKNKNRKVCEKPLLLFMGDDTHLGEKLKKPEHQDKEKIEREIGYQPAWDELDIKKSLILGNFSRNTTIDDYKNRLENP